MKTSSRDEILAFLKFDRWSEDRATGHDFFEKILPNGEILHTYTSWSRSKTISPGRFKVILSDQLRVGEAEFWEVLRTREPATRPSPAPELPPASIPMWIAEALEREVGLSREQIADLDERDARALVDEVRSRPRE